MTERKRTLPNWDDERAVARLADEIIADAERSWRIWTLAVSELSTRRAGDEFDEFRYAEKDAVKAALRGDVAPLAKLLLDENWQRLQPETRKVMSEIMLGKRQSTGRSGRPEMTSEERMAANPIHRAEANADVLKSRLRKLYPGIARAAVRERAMEIVAKRTGVSLEALRRQLNRSRKDLHRIARVSVAELTMEIVAKRTGVSLEALRRQLNHSRKDPHRIS
jgi:DNA-binding phage protein